MQLHGKNLWLSFSAIALVAILAISTFVFFRGDNSSLVKTKTHESKDFPLPPIATSQFQNTNRDVKYVGSDACVACHAKETDSFRQTGMGISTALVDPSKEPPDGEFTHAKSGHRYQVFRKDGQLWHRDIDPAQNNKVTEYPVKYVIGSGINARTYAIEDKGFLAESPLTWYSKPDQWNLSPGYDLPQNKGFEREISVGCLFCHAGRANAIDNSMQRIQIHEAAIGCERCHGPGELHVANRTDGVNKEGVDYTIVNPPHLDRERAEAICQQCHLHIEATVPIRGRSASDFRPGLLLSDFRQDYQFETSAQGMNVVGHVEQMHLSKCYINTSTLTCTTCHNPHDFPKPEQRVQYYRNVCTQCHELEKCTVDPQLRQQQSPDNDCIKCHMPTAKTEIQHVAFTHHRIGIHKDSKTINNHAIGTELTPWNANNGLSSIDQELTLGLAYAQLAMLKPERAMQYNGKAVRTLMKVHKSGLDDPVLNSVLARLELDNGRADARAIADQALASSSIRPEDRCVSLFVAAATRLGANQPKEALPLLKELVRSRRYAIDWAMLSEAEKMLGHTEEANKAIQEAHRINPSAK